MDIWLPYTKSTGGAEVFIEILSSQLKKNGHNVYASAYPHYIQYFPWLLSYVKKPAHIDVILATSWLGFALKKAHIPLVIIEHHCVLAPAYTPYRNFAQKIFHELMIRPFEKASLRAADAIVTVSHYTAHSLSKLFTLALSNITVIHNGVDTDFYTPEPSGKRSIDGRKIRLLYVGNLSRRKGADLLPHIMQRLGEDYELYYTGGLRENKLFSQQQNIHSLGRLTNEELRDEYRKADILLFPSRFEGFGYPPVEAMACGTPVVTTDSSSLSEIVEDGATGILCPINDIKAFSEAIKSLSNSTELLLRMGMNGRSRAMQLFSLNTMAKKYIDLFNDLQT